jgi:hypothetical protein
MKCKIWAAALILLTVNCGGSDIEKNSDGSLGITEAVPETRLSGFFEQEGTRVYFEARSHTIPFHPENSESRPRETDVRFLDSAGRQFIIDAGGHALIDDAWPFEVDLTGVDQQDRQHHLDLLLPLSKALAKHEVSPDLVLERDKLVGIARGVAEIREERVEKSFSPTSISVGGGGPISCNCEHEVEIRKKGAFIKSDTWADHSAILLKVVSVGTSSRSLLGTISTSNHGTSAADGSMSTKCSRSFSRTSNITDLEYEPCSTAYPVHVCNDDTYLQYMAIHDGTSPTDRSTCSAWGIRTSAPDCW